MNRYCIFIFCFLWGASAQAQLAKYSNEFLSLGIGARALGMGNAVVAGVDDVDGNYWNPAALQQIEDKVQFSLMHNEQFAGIVKHDFVSVAYRYDEKSVLGLSLIRAGVDDIPNTLNLFQNGQMDYSRISSFSAVDYALIGSYARNPGIEHLSVGANVKIIRRIIGNFASSWGFGFDIGAQYQHKRFRYGVSLRDVTTTFNVWSFNFSEAEKEILRQTNNTVPGTSLELTAPKTIIGISGKWEFFNKRLILLPEINADITLDGERNVLFHSPYINLDPKAGLELSYRNLIYLRGGFMNLQRQKTIDGQEEYTVMPSVGAGVRINQFVVDYALANPGSGSSLPYSNIISVKLGIRK